MNKKKYLAKKGSRQGRKKSLCAFPTLRLCVNKKRRPSKARYPAVGGLSAFARKIMSRKEGGTQRKKSLCGFAALRLCVNKKKYLAKKGSRQGRKKSLCAFPTLRLCVNKKRRPSKARYPAVGGLSAFARKIMSRKEGESPRKKEIPLRLSYFASLREQKKKTFQSSLPCRRRA